MHPRYKAAALVASALVAFSGCKSTKPDATLTEPMLPAPLSRVDQAIQPVILSTDAKIVVRFDPRSWPRVAESLQKPTTELRNWAAIAQSLLGPDLYKGISDQVFKLSLTEVSREHDAYVLIPLGSNDLAGACFDGGVMCDYEALTRNTTLTILLPSKTTGQALIDSVTGFLTDQPVTSRVLGERYVQFDVDLAGEAPKASVQYEASPQRAMSPLLAHTLAGDHAIGVFTEPEALQRGLSNSAMQRFLTFAETASPEFQMQALAADLTQQHLMSQLTDPATMELSEWGFFMDASADGEFVGHALATRTPYGQEAAKALAHGGKVKQIKDNGDALARVSWNIDLRQVAKTVPPHAGLMRWTQSTSQDITRDLGASTLLALASSPLSMYAAAYHELGDDASRLDGVWAGQLVLVPNKEPTPMLVSIALSMLSPQAVADKALDQLAGRISEIDPDVTMTPGAKSADGQQSTFTHIKFEDHIGDEVTPSRGEIVLDFDQALNLQALPVNANMREGMQLVLASLGKWNASWRGDAFREAGVLTMGLAPGELPPMYDLPAPAPAKACGVDERAKIMEKMKVIGQEPGPPGARLLGRLCVVAAAEITALDERFEECAASDEAQRGRWNRARGNHAMLMGVCAATAKDAAAATAHFERSCALGYTSMCDAAARDAVARPHLPYELLPPKIAVPAGESLQ